VSINIIVEMNNRIREQARSHRGPDRI
jgi:hypothetical protein